MYSAIFNSLSSDQRLWYGEAVVRVIMADGKRHRSEEAFLQKIVAMFPNTADRKRLNTLLKSGVSPTRKIGDISDSTKLMLFYDLVVIAVSDGEFVKEEEDELYKISKELNISPTEASNIISWGKSLIERFSLAV